MRDERVLLSTTAVGFGVINLCLAHMQATTGSTASARAKHARIATLARAEYA